MEIRNVEKVQHHRGAILVQQNAITLISLIITIIILLILAGVVLNFAIGENGILKQAEYAGEKYENKAQIEQQELAQLDDYISNGRDTVTISKEEYNMLKNANKYSEDEIIIGNWINGKKLYRKVYILNESMSIYTNTEWNKLISISGIEDLVSCTCKSNISNKYPNRVNNGLYKYENGYIQVYSPSYGFPIDYIIIEYTKTTDTATNN